MALLSTHGLICQLHSQICGVEDWFMQIRQLSGQGHGHHSIEIQDQQYYANDGLISVIHVIFFLIFNHDMMRAVGKYMPAKAKACLKLLLYSVHNMLVAVSQHGSPQLEGSEAEALGNGSSRGSNASQSVEKVRERGAMISGMHADFLGEQQLSQH